MEREACLSCGWWDGERLPQQIFDGRTEDPIAGRMSNPNTHRGRCMVNPPTIFAAINPDTIKWEDRTYWPWTAGADGCSRWRDVEL